MLLINVRYRWPVSEGLHVHPRTQRSLEYACLHFYHPVKLRFENETISLDSGAFIVIRPGVPFSYESPTPYMLDKLYLIGNVTELMQMYGLKPHVVYYPSNSEQISSLFEIIEFGFYLKSSWGYRYFDIKFEELLIILAMNSGTNGELPSNVEIYHRLTALRQEMQIYPERDWSVNTIASRIGMSASRLYPVYKSMFNISPNKDLIHMRINNAKQLLRQGRSLTESAHESGYDDICYFVRQFKKETGLTPGQYQHEYFPN